MQKIEYIKIDELKSHPDNPRIIKNKQFNVLCKSIKDNPDYFETRPILCNTDMVIFAGNMRWRAAKEVGMTQVPVAVMDIPLERQREIMIRDNRENGEWDFEKLANHFDFEELLDWGFTDNELDMFKEVEEDDVPAVDNENEPTAKIGDLYQLGQHRLLCGDATKIEDVDMLMDGSKANMVFTDPPYNVDYQGGMHADGTQSKRDKIKNDKMTSAQFYDFLSDIMSNLLSVTNGAFYVCMSSSELHNLWKAFTDNGGHWQTYIIWAKDAFTLSRSDYQHQFEPIMYGLDNKTVNDAINEVDEDKLPIMYGWSKHNWYGGRKQGDVWRFDRPKISREHPTMKPVALCAKAIQNSSLRGDIVLDVFGGSGSTLIACEQLDRKCYMMEMEPKYIDVIVKRWEQFTGEKATKLN